MKYSVKWTSMWLVALVLPIVIFGCTKNRIGETPDDVVRKFVELSISAKSFEDRTKLQNICIGEMRRTFERMNEEAFNLIYLNTKLQLNSFNVVESYQQGDVAKVVYKVSINNNQGTDPTKEINSREVELRLSQGGWFIENIRVKGSDQVAFTRGMIF